MATTLSLSSARWLLRPIGTDATRRMGRREIPAAVPGNVHLDLMRAGVIGDPAVADNERLSQWVGESDWEYAAEFHAGPALIQHERTDLVLEGLDTVAEVHLNGGLVGSCANFFHPQRFDVRGLLRRGRNDIRVTFRSPLKHIRAEEARMGPLPVNGDWDPYVFIRKPACNFGWDWGPKVPTVGIAGPVRIEGWSGARITSVRPLIKRMTSRRWRIDVHIAIERSGTEGSFFAQVALSKGGLSVATARRAIRSGGGGVVVPLHLTDPELWWPRGHGGQPRYRLHATLVPVARRPKGLPRDTEHRRVRGVDAMSCDLGFRTVRLDTARDRRGSAFTFVVNDRPIFCKGANWIPEGLFAGYADAAEVKRRLRQAAAANMNMIRVWGGGQYESRNFYSECDRLGLMVWQDFQFSCACYPEEAPFPALIEAEVRHQIAKLSPHPSLVLWCGGNECTWAHENWGFKERVRPGRGWGSRYYFDLLPQLCSELDPTRPYWPNSPHTPSNKRPGRWVASDPAGITPPNEASSGDRHTWDVWGDGFRTIVPRFCSEFGQQSPSCIATLHEALGETSLQAHHGLLKARQRGPGGMDRWCAAPLRAMFGVDAATLDFDTFHFLMQVLQSRLLATGIEWLRVNQGECMGALLWQLNDAWPGYSWSLVDSAGRPKPAYFAVRRAMAPRLLSIQPIERGVSVHAVNDSPRPWRTRVRSGMSGEELLCGPVEFMDEIDIPPWGARKICTMPDVPPRLRDPDGRSTAGAAVVWARSAGGAERAALIREVGGPMRAGEAGSPALSVRARRRGLRVELHLEALRHIRDVVLAPDRVSPGAMVSDNAFSMLRGERRRVVVTGAGRGTLSRWTLPPVVQWLE